MISTEAAVPKAIEFITERQNVTFVELGRFLESLGVATKGDATISNPTNPNVHLWFGMSDQFLEVFSGLMGSGRIEIEPTTHLTYYADGTIPDLPPVRNAQTKYKTERWHPALLSASNAD